MPAENADRNRGLWGILATVLMLLLPGSVALQMGLRQADASGADSARGEQENKKESTEAAGSAKKAGSCLQKPGSALSLLAAYYNLDLCSVPEAGAVRGCYRWLEPPSVPPDPSCKLDRLFALVPEQTWGLDGAIESIVRAYERTGFALVRKSLPWKSTDTGATSPGEEVPGVLLFHRERDAETQTQIVYLIEETPAEGVREAAFDAAFSDWQDVASVLRQDTKIGLRVLGPTFSGSAARLGRLIALMQDRYPATRGFVRVLSGSATSREAGKVLERSYKDAWTRSASPVGPQLQYQTTVRSSEEMREAMWRYLTEQLRVAPNRIALVVESSTGYGRSFLPSAPTLTPFGDTMTLSIPYNLSRIQEEWNKKGANKAAQPTELEQQKTLGRLQHSATRRGAFPILDRSAITTHDLTLTALLDAICQQGIQFVGLMLTDPDDKRFLAQRMSLECPDVRLFSFESEIEYLHREDYPFMRGMLVATSYPLYIRNQQWSSVRWRVGWHPPLLQFARQSEQGIYNATLLLLDKADSELLQEYGPPSFVRRHDILDPAKDQDSRKRLTASLRPPVWISAVGRQGLSPLRAYEDFRNESGYVVRVQPPLKPASPAPSMPFDLGTIHILLFLVTAAALVHAWAYFGGRHGRPPRNGGDGSLRPVYGLLSAGQERPSRYLLAVMIPMAVMLCYLMLILALRFRPDNLIGLSSPDWSFIEDLLYTLAALVGIAGTLLATLDVLLLQSKRIRDSWSHLSQRVVRSLGMRVLVLASAVAALGTLAFLFFKRIESNPTAILFLRRCSQTAYELSPLIPALFLAAIVYLWGLSNLRRVYRLQSHPLTAPVGIRRPGDAADEKTEQLNSLLRRTPPRIWLLAAAGTLLATLPVLRRLGTIDHWALSMAFRTLFMGCTLLVVVSLARLLRGWQLLRSLLARVGHHPISSALMRLSPELTRPLDSFVLSELSPRTELAITQQSCLAVQDAYAKVDAAQRQAWEAAAVAAGDASSTKLQVWQDPDGNPPSETASLDRDAPQLASFLVKTGAWPQEGRPVLPRPIDEKQPVSFETAFFRRIEELLAARLVAFLCHVLSHLRSAMLFISLSLILMLLALNSYPFQPMQWLTIMVWLLFLISMALSGYVLIQMNREPVLGLISHGQSRGLTWDAPLARNLAIYILAPLLSLFATKIPALSWFSKLLQNLK